MNDLISIIVPIYNSEKTLDRCIKSIVNQKYINLEILLIDDGSTDKSKEICQKWIKMDKRIKYFLKKNTGAGDTRNYGIKKAKGQYIGFVDSDDEILPDMYDMLYNIIVKEKINVVGCSNYDYIENTNNKKERTLNFKDGYVDSKELIMNILYQTPSAWGAVWNKLYKKDIFDNLKFPCSSTMEDYLVSIKIFYENNIYILKKPLYIHYINENSLTHRKFNKKMLSGLKIIDEIEGYLTTKSNNNIHYLRGCNYLKLNLYEFICHAIYHEKENNNLKIIKDIKKEINKNTVNFFGIYGKIKALKIIIKINVYYLLIRNRLRKKNGKKGKNK